MTRKEIDAAVAWHKKYPMATWPVPIKLLLALHRRLQTAERQLRQYKNIDIAGKG